MLFQDIIEKIRSTDARTEKEAIIEAEATNRNSDFFKGLALCLDSMISFGVKKVPVHTGVDGPGLTFAEFVTLAERLQNRELTGNAAKVAVEEAMEKATRAEWDNWYRLILMKDLKAGISQITVNNVVEQIMPEYKIDVFECQLAKDCLDEHGNFNEADLKGKKLVDVKLDGCRCITIVYPNGKVLQFTRNGKELVNFEVICNQLSEIAGQFSEPTVLDGEIMSASFQDLMKQARRKTDVQADDSILHVFDILPLSDFIAGKCAHTQQYRT
jgi:DNA ligase-1